MLNESEITLVESVYLALDLDVLTSEIALQIQDYVYKHNFEQHVYLLQWLINRWSFLKRDKHHLPLRTINLNKYVECIHIHHPIIQIQNKKRKCKSCSHQQSAKHNICSSCGFTKPY